MPDNLSAILDASSGPVAIFTDFDGTLVDIAPTPDAVIVPEALAARLDALFSVVDGALAVISGRAIADIEGFLPGQPFSMSGSHGAEQRHDGEFRPLDPATSARARAIATALQTRLGPEPGLLIEPKPTGVALHFRAAPEKEPLVRQAIASVLDDGGDGFEAIDGKKVVEIRPAGTDKGAALDALMDLPPFRGRIPVFIGDDVTDEDGFRAAERHGGFGIRVGAGPTAARFTLPDIAAVYAYFDVLIGARRTTGPSAHSLEGGIVT